MTLAKTGYAPQLHKLDNESSTEVEDFITSQNSAIHYVLPDNHHTNATEWAIQTWKNHFKLRLATL